MQELTIFAVSWILGVISGYLLKKIPKFDVTPWMKRLQEAEERAASIAEAAEAEVVHAEKVIALEYESKIAVISKVYEEAKVQYEKTAFLVTPEISELTSQAVELAKIHESADMSGEAKRHQVYSRLIKQNPDAALKDIAMAIELAVRKL